MTSSDAAFHVDRALGRFAALDLPTAVDRVRSSPFVLDVLQAADALAHAAAADSGARTVAVLHRMVLDDDELAAIAGVHALAKVFDDSADAVLSELLSHDRAFLREHAAWALGSRLPRLDAVGRLVAAVVSGGFSGVLAQRTLEQWAPFAADHVALAVEGALSGQPDAAVRARLVETLGLLPSSIAARAVDERAADDAETQPVRAAAVAALGDRRGDERAERLVHDLARGSGEIAAVARLAAVDLGLTAPVVHQRHGGLTVAQLFLHADIDRGLTRAGAGDNGGVATLLVRLGDALLREPSVERVLTLSRGSAEAAADALVATDGQHVLAPVPLLQPPTPAADAWPARVAAARGIRRVLRAHGPVDVLHLRMAEVGSLAAAEVAAALKIRTVFTLAPDPHAVIHALDMTGALTRQNFGAVDEREHYWFRARLVQRLAADAEHIALFPRPQLRDDLRELVGVDVEAEPDRFTVVAEGIDLSVTESARRQLDDNPPAFVELEELVRGLPEHRRGLPLAISVGRLHRVKGMATVVEAWATDPRLRERCNLVIVGGDLDDPSRDEREQLDLIASLDAGPGLILAGHRRNDEVALWLAAARHGRGALIAPGGIYVCGSLKEEFGLALLEALAAGLVVVAPAGGGPATYVEDGRTGYLVDTRSPARLGEGMVAALDLAARPAAERVEQATRMIGSRFTVEAMAATLSIVYSGVVQAD